MSVASLIQAGVSVRQHHSTRRERCGVEQCTLERLRAYFILALGLILPALHEAPASAQTNVQDVRILATVGGICLSGGAGACEHGGAPVLGAGISSVLRSGVEIGGVFVETVRAARQVDPLVPGGHLDAMRRDVRIIAGRAAYVFRRDQQLRPSVGLIAGALRELSEQQGTRSTRWVPHVAVDLGVQTQWSNGFVAGASLQVFGPPFGVPVVPLSVTGSIGYAFRRSAN